MTQQLALAITSLLTIIRGAIVRSWDSMDHARRCPYKGSWVEGIVQDIATGPDGVEKYQILVTQDYYQGRMFFGEGSRVGQMVYVPVNGTKKALGGGVCDGVEFLDEIPCVTYQASESEGCIKFERGRTVQQIVNALSARLTAEDMIDEYDALGAEYKYERRGPEGLTGPLCPDTPIPGHPNFEISVQTGGSEGHRVTVRMNVQDDTKDNYGYNPYVSTVIYSVKTFSGFEGAFRIAKCINQLLGV